MICVLDAHVLLWWLSDDPTLVSAARASIADPANEVIVSAATIWELEIKRALGKLEVPDDLLGELKVAQLDCLAVTGADAITAARLPMHHRDPFDRMLLAQAIRLDAVLISRDQAFEAYGVPVMRA